MNQWNVLAACVLSSVATVALGATHNWTGEGGDHLFSTPENWADGLSPDTWAASDNAVLFYSSAETVISNDVEGLVLSYLTVTNKTSASTAATLAGKPLSLTRNSGSSGYTKDPYALKNFCPLSVRLPLAFSVATYQHVWSLAAISFYEPVTFAGTTLFLVGGKPVNFYETVTSATGAFQSFSGDHTYYHKAIDVAGVYSGSDGSACVHLMAASNRIGKVWSSYYARITAEKPYAFSTNTVLTYNSDYPSYGASGDYNRRLEIQGDEIADRVTGTANPKDGLIIYRGQIVATTTSTLTLCGTADAEAWIRLTGSLTVAWDPVGDFRQTFNDYAHTMTGELIVKGGTFASGGTNTFAKASRLRIAEGARFAVTNSDYSAATNPFPNRIPAYLDGTIEVPAGVTVTLGAVRRNGRYIPNGTYQRTGGTAPDAAGVDWIEGDGLVSVLDEAVNYWCGPTSGNWRDGANWTFGIAPTASSSAVIDAAGADFVVTLAEGDELPAKLRLEGVNVKLLAPENTSFLYDGASKTAAWQLKDGAVLRLEGEDVTLTNFVGTFTIESSVAATSKVEIASGRFCFAPKSGTSNPITLKTGGAIDACGGLFKSPGNTKATVALRGGKILASGAGKVDYMGDGKPVNRLTGSGEAIFSGKSSYSWNNTGINEQIYPDAAGGSLYVSFRDYAKMAVSANGLDIGSKDTVTVLEFASETNHTMCGYCVIVGGSGTGYAELRLAAGTLPVGGGRGISVGLGTGSLTSPVDGRLVVLGGTLEDQGSNGGWSDQGRQNGLLIGYAAGATSTQGRLVKGSALVSGGTVKVLYGVTLVGTGHAVGRYVQTGGTLKHDGTTEVFGVGQGGGEGWFVQSNGTVTVAGPAYVGGFWTNILTMAEKTTWSVKDRHDAEGTLVFAGGTATFKKHLVLGADGRGTLVRAGAAGTFKVTGNLVLSNTVENAASGGTLKFVYDETDGVAPLAVSGKLVIRPGARIEVDLGDYATQKSYKAKRYLVQPTGGVEGDFSSVARSVVGARAGEAVIKVDANGVYAHVPRGVLILVR